MSINNLNSIADYYDEVIYESYPYSQSSPEKLATLGKLFGMNPPAIETARVLELGCAGGGNIIPHAVKYPKAKFIGVDLSKAQIDQGLSEIKAMGLKNIELKHASITDIDESFGKFDYIICHGVFSWVPDFVQEKILEISSKNLSENGIAYISYNTLPGWNTVRTVRDMMMYHAKSFAETKDKVLQSRALMNFVKESLEGTDTSYAKMLAQEADLLSKQRDSYLLHEHLEENNKQFYFTEFMEKAASHGLQYLSDTSLAAMYLGNLKPSIAEKLKEINDIIRTEQYLDFLSNRRFRCTLLCHNNVRLSRNLDNNHIKDFAMSLDIVPEKPIDPKTIEKSTETIKFLFKSDQNQHVSSNSPFLSALLYVFSENKGYPMKFDTVIEKANKFFTEDSKQQLTQNLLHNAMILVIKGYMDISLFEKDKTKVNLEKPLLNKLALHQLNSDASWVTTSQHNAFGLNIFDKFALKYMDGKHTKKQITEKLFKEVEDGKLTVSMDDKKVEDKEQINTQLANILDRTIENLAAVGMLE